MSINLTPDLEELVRRRAAESGLDENAFVAKVLRDSLETDADSSPAPESPPRRRKPISERFAEIRDRAPEEVRQALRELPKDFAAEHDHYLYGAPKKGS